MFSDNQSASTEPQARPTSATIVQPPTEPSNNLENTPILPPAPVYNLAFPPFPSTLGRDVIPFSDFVPKGLVLKDDEDEEEQQEVDGEGVPTVLLGVTHDLDKPKSKKKRTAIRTVIMDPVTGQPLPRRWYEQWEDNEPMMTAMRLDPSQCSPSECLMRADEDFTKRRYFPITVRQLYDEWRGFIGLLEVIPKVSRFPKRRFYPKKENQKEDSGSKPTNEDTAEADEEGNFSDDVPEDEEDGAAPKEPEFPAFSLNEPPPANIEEEDDREYEGDLEPLQDRAVTLPAHARMEQFFLDPVLAVKCFLSHEFLNRGLYWSEFNLKAAPIIVTAFLDFLIRHSLIHEDYRKSLKEAAEAARFAVTELPRTWKVAKVLRDDWGTVCVDLYGERLSVHQGLDDSVLGVPVGQDDEGYVTEVPIVAELVETNDAPDNGDAVLDDLAVAPRASEDDNKAPTPAQDAWGTADEGNPPSPTFDNPYAKDVAPTWEIASPPSLFQFVGCSTFPLTHGPARAERSCRQILRVDPPKNLLDSTHANPISLLHAHLAMIVLGPWKDPLNGQGDLEAPEMLKMEIASDEPRPDYAEQFWKSHEPGLKFDPLNDEITVFVDPSIINTLQLGVGLGLKGTFVQVARRLNAPIFPVPLPAEEGAPKKKKPYYNNRANNTNASPKLTPFDGRSWWYIDTLTAVIPSFWTETTLLPIPDDD